MRIALVHDDLVQWGGAERVLLALTEAFPQSPIYTAVFDKSNRILAEKFQGKKIFTSFIQRIPEWKILYKALLPLHGLAFEQFDFSGFDLVISQTTRFANAIITKPQTKHICYCHTPPRFLWNFSQERVSGLLKPYLTFLRIYDRIISTRVDKWLAGSVNAQKRIKEVYQAHSRVVYPFVDLQRFSKVEVFDGGYLLVVSRLNGYKRVDLAVQVANQLKIPLKIVGTGPKLADLMRLAGPTVEFLSLVDDNLIVKLLAGCQAVIISASEDFGLTALEAQAMGKPVIAFRAGGALETVIEGKTGIFFDSQTTESLKQAIKRLDRNKISAQAGINQAKRFSKDRFINEFRKIAKEI